MIYRFIMSLIVAIVLRPVFTDDVQYMACCFLVGIGLVVTCALIEGKINEKK